MNISWYIAQKLAVSRGGSFTSLIIKICIATTAISIAVMIIAMGLIYGFKKEISNKIYQFWGHISINHIDVTQQYAPVPIRVSDCNLDGVLEIKDSVIIPGTTSGQRLFRQLQSFVLYPGMIKAGDAIEGIQLKGGDASFDPLFFEQFLVDGKIPEWASGKTSESRSILVSQVTAKRLKLKTNDDILLYFIRDRQQLVRKFTVSGIYNTGLEEYDRKIALIDAQTLQQILGWEADQFTGFELYLNDISLIDQAVDWLYDEILPQDILPVGIRSRFPAIFEWLDLQDYNRMLIIFLMIVVCIFNISTTVIVLIIERKNMVGLLKAMGLAFRPLQMIFVLMSLRILAWSLLIGNSIGISLCYLQHEYRFIQLNESDYYLSYAPIHFVWNEWLVLNIGVVVLVFLVLLVPAAFIQRIDPVKVIQYR